MTSPLDTASSLLWWSNVLYVVGAVLTLGTSAIVLFEKRQIGKGLQVKQSVRNEVFFLISALICLAGTCGAIYFGKRVSEIKDADLATYETSADVQIAQAQNDAAKAKAAAAAANLQNTHLRIDLASHETDEKKIDAQLTAQNKRTNDFAHALAHQQETISEQTKGSPEIDRKQADVLANSLIQYAGQSVSVHMTLDTVVVRLAKSLGYAFSKAGIQQRAEMDAGATYQGVSVAVHSPKDVPPLANALVLGLRQAGIDAHPVSLAAIPAGQVAIYLGPN